MPWAVFNNIIFGVYFVRSPGIAGSIYEVQYIIYWAMHAFSFEGCNNKFLNVTLQKMFYILYGL